MAEYNRDKKNISIKQVDANKSIYWINGKLFFENESLTYIFKELERTYNVTIKCNPSNKLNSDNFNGLFTKDKNVYQILDVIKSMGGFTYINVNDTIFIN